MLGQPSHVPSLVGTKSASQKQSDCKVLAAGESMLTGQLEHATEPVMPLYVPVPHAVHGPPLNPV